MKRFPFALILFCFLSVQVAGQDKASPEGIWLGTLNVQGTSLRLGLTISASDSGEIQGLFNSLDQGRTEFPADKVELEGDTLTVSHAATGILIKGALDPSGEKWDTRFSQMNFTSDLQFLKVDRLPD